MDAMKDLLVNVGLRVEGVGSVDAASDALARLADSAERAASALRSLEGMEHGGITIKVSGSLALVEVKPANRAA